MGWGPFNPSTLGRNARGTVPIGTVVAFLVSLTGVPSLVNQNRPDWIACNGQTQTDSSSPITAVIPNLNGASAGVQRFLRGSTTSGTTSGCDCVTLSTSGAGVTSGASFTAVCCICSISIIPSNYEVNWILNIK